MSAQKTKANKIRESHLFDQQDYGRTHWEGCYASPGHRNCAIRLLLGEVDGLLSAIRKVRAHTSYLPGAEPGLLMGLLASIERIAEEALEKHGN